MTDIPAPQRADTLYRKARIQSICHNCGALYSCIRRQNGTEPDCEWIRKALR